MIIDSIANLVKYVPEEHKKTVSDIIAGINDYEVGQYDINDKIVVKRVSSKTHVFKETKIESHRYHIDIQIPMNIMENMNVYEIDGAVTKTQYDEAKDVVFYEHLPPKCYAETHIHVGQFIYLAPNELHQPQIATDEIEEPIEKLVIKIEVDE